MVHNIIDLSKVNQIELILDIPSENGESDDIVLLGVHVNLSNKGVL
jgi:hypothetical protein